MEFSTASPLIVRRDSGPISGQITSRGRSTISTKLEKVTKLNAFPFITGRIYGHAGESGRQNQPESRTTYSSLSYVERR